MSVCAQFAALKPARRYLYLAFQCWHVLYLNQQLKPTLIPQRLRSSRGDNKTPEVGDWLRGHLVQQPPRGQICFRHSLWGGGAVLIEIFCKSCFEELQRIHEGIQPLGAAKMLTLFFLFYVLISKSHLSKSQKPFLKRKKKI